jgi:hypothetical protein
MILIGSARSSGSRSGVINARPARLSSAFDRQAVAVRPHRSGSLEADVPLTYPCTPRAYSLGMEIATHGLGASPRGELPCTVAREVR